MRRSWVRDDAPQHGDVVLADGKRVCEIVVGEHEPACVNHAAVFLARDIEKITGKRPDIVPKAHADHLSAITLWTAPNDEDATKWPWHFGMGDWEAYQIQTLDGRDVALTGSDGRGTAYAAYTLAERLGVDPLYLWTGYVPERHETLVMKNTDWHTGPPTVKLRGFFHDDEDILPRPFEPSGYPFRYGDVPNEWYEKYFETALRLRMNMVAPYTRVHRRYEVQKMASDWGLFYTSHHYDILLSNPFGMQRYVLAEKRSSGKEWSWTTNRAGMMRYWGGGVEENKDLDCVWPVGLRGTDDTSYKFPNGTSEQEKQKVFREAIEAQVALVKKTAGGSPAPQKTALFAFTMYAEMLENYLRDPGAFGLPEDVTIIWPDDQDGRIRYLPSELGKWKHGVYYHLAYLGPVPKQSAHVVTPAMVAREFKKVIDAGATEYMLVNVSEMREFVMEGRMIAEVCWDGKSALTGMPVESRPSEPLANVPTTQEAVQPASNTAGDRYVEWWCREYFGAAAAPLAADAYHRYYRLIGSFDKQYYGSEQVKGMIERMVERVKDSPAKQAGWDVVGELTAREGEYRKAFEVIERAREQMTRPQRQFFFDHLELPLLMDWRPVQSALALAKGVNAADVEGMWKACDEGMRPLEELEVEIARAEHPPFELWYRKTWIRRENQVLNVHRPYEQLRAFVSSHGRDVLHEPEGARRPVFPARRD